MTIEKTNESLALIAVIERCAVNPETDILKMEKLLDMQERIMNRVAYQEYCAAFAEMQGELPEIEERGEIKIHGKVQSTYALVEDINEAIKPILKKYGFGLFHRNTQGDGTLTTTAILMHKGGHFQETQLTVPLDITGNKNNVQSVGSSFSYTKRYTTCAVLNITTRGQDDDGEHLDPLITEVQKKIIHSLFNQFSEVEKEMFTNATGGIDAIKRKEIDSIIAKMKRTLELKSKPGVRDARNS